MSEHESTKRWWSDAERDPVHAAAAEWFTRLQDPQASLDVTLAWQRWMGEDARNAEAFARIEEVWNTLGDISPEPVASLVADADSFDGSIALSDHRVPSFARRHRTAFAIAASVLMAMVLTLLLANRDWLAARSDGAQVMRTAIGENRSVRLEDGSRVTLGGGTELQILLRKDSRRISLRRGEAFFKVAKDASRPFRVRAGDAAVTAVGTEFNVRRGGDRVTVVVVEGRVVVERSSRLVRLEFLRELRPTLQPVRVDAGQQTTVGDEGIEQATQLVDPNSLRRGRRDDWRIRESRCVTFWRT